MNEPWFAGITSSILLIFSPFRPFKWQSMRQHILILLLSMVPTTLLFTISNSFHLLDCFGKKGGYWIHAGRIKEHGNNIAILTVV